MSVTDVQTQVGVGGQKMANDTKKTKATNPQKACP